MSPDIHDYIYTVFIPCFFLGPYDTDTHLQTGVDLLAKVLPRWFQEAPLCFCLSPFAWDEMGWVGSSVRLLQVPTNV